MVLRRLKYLPTKVVEIYTIGTLSSVSLSIIRPPSNISLVIYGYTYRDSADDFHCPLVSVAPLDIFVLGIVADISIA